MTISSIGPSRLLGCLEFPARAQDKIALTHLTYVSGNELVSKDHLSSSSPKVLDIVVVPSQSTASDPIGPGQVHGPGVNFYIPPTLPASVPAEEAVHQMRSIDLILWQTTDTRNPKNPQRTLEKNLTLGSPWEIRRVLV